MRNSINNLWQGLPAKIASLPAAYVAGIFLIIIFEYILTSLFLILHLKLFFLALAFGFNQYTTDFILTTIKSILIINTQIALTLVGLKLYKLEAGEIGLKIPSAPWKILAGILLAVFAEIFFNFSGFYFLKGHLPPMVRIEPSILWLNLHNPVAYHLLFTIPFVLPIFEELFFRGFVQTAFKKRFGNIVSILVTAMIFTLWHYKNPHSNFNITIFFIAIILGSLKEWDGSIWSSAAAHCAYNFLTSALIIKFS